MQDRNGSRDRLGSNAILEIAPAMPSSVIRTFFYDVESLRLTVIFQSGSRYVYDAVPEDIYRELAASPSKGTYFNENIRDRFQSRRFDRAG